MKVEPKVAIIGHDKESLRELGEILAGGGYTPIPVSDIRSAINTVIQKKPDVVLVDLSMSSKTGFEITDVINLVSETKIVPIIAIPKSFNEEHSWFLDLCSIKKCIKKPFFALAVIWAVENDI